MSSRFGEKIRNAWKVSGISQKEFAEKLNMSLRNTQHLFERNDFSIQQLLQISQVLNVDLVKVYLEDFKADNPYPTSEDEGAVGMVKDVLENFIGTPPVVKNEISIQVSIKGDFTLVTKYFPELMSSFKREAEKYGLHLS